jgi:hypothetical protein
MGNRTEQFLNEELQVANEKHVQHSQPLEE